MKMDDAPQILQAERFIEMSGDIGPDVVDHVLIGQVCFPPKPRDRQDDEFIGVSRVFKPVKEPIGNFLRAYLVMGKI
ncbi:hypothetical protein D3C75_1126090 [compost metagenome]